VPAVITTDTVRGLRDTLAAADEPRAAMESVGLIERAGAPEQARRRRGRWWASPPGML